MKTWRPGDFVTSADLDQNFEELDATEADTTAALASWFSGSGQPQFLRVQVGARDWLEVVRPGSEVAIQGGGLSAMSPVGASAAVFGSRSSDNSNAGGASFTLGVFSFNNNINAVQGMQGEHIEAWRYAGTGTAQGLEVGMVNLGEEVDANPWYMGATGSTLAFWASGGRQDVHGNPLTLALGIVDNGAPFKKGIVFGWNSLLTGPVGAEALCLATGQGVMWHGSGDFGVTSCIRSDTNAASSTGLRAVIFTDTGAVIRTPDGVNSLDVSSGLIKTTAMQVNLGLTVEGVANLVGGASVGGQLNVFNLAVTNLAQITNGMSVGGALTAYDLAVTHHAAIAAGASITGDLSVSNLTTLTNGATVGGQLTAFNLSVSNVANITNGASVGGQLTSYDLVATHSARVAGVASLDHLNVVLGSAFQGPVAIQHSLGGRLNILGMSAFANDAAAAAGGYSVGDMYIDSTNNRIWYRAA